MIRGVSSSSVFCILAGRKEKREPAYLALASMPLTSNTHIAILYSSGSNELQFISYKGAILPIHQKVWYYPESPPKSIFLSIRYPASKCLDPHLAPNFAGSHIIYTIVCGLYNFPPG